MERITSRSNPLLVHMKKLAGSGAYRWACALRRLDACDPEGVAALLREAIGC